LRAVAPAVQRPLVPHQQLPMLAHHPALAAEVVVLDLPDLGSLKNSN
jgi:hypothetical protein